MSRNFVTTSISRPARDALRHLAAMTSGMVGVPVSASDAIRIADVVLAGQREEVLKAFRQLGLANPEGEES